MKNDLLRRMEAKYKAMYEALFRQKMRMVLQLSQDAAMIAANEVLQMGPGRAEDFNRAEGNMADMKFLRTRERRCDAWINLT